MAPRKGENLPSKAPRKATQKRAVSTTAKPKRKQSPAQLANLAPKFQPGNSGNPSGKPRGLRNAVSQQFLGDMLKVWNEANEEGNHTGLDAIRIVAKTRPGQFINAMGNLVPREISLDDETTEGFMGIWQALAKASASRDE